MKKNILMIAGIFFLFGYSFQSEPPIKNAYWLIGTWENNTSRGTIFETWTMISETRLTAKSYIVKNNDTTVFETIRLIQRNDSLFYIPTVKRQNNNLPVNFAHKLITDSLMIFENPLHDFPQIISYKKITPDSLVAEISGKRNGEFRKQTFPMKRKQESKK